MTHQHDKKTALEAILEDPDLRELRHAYFDHQAFELSPELKKLRSRIKERLDHQPPTSPTRREK